LTQNKHALILGKKAQSLSSKAEASSIEVKFEFIPQLGINKVTRLISL
jgi:hypothetical protein